MCRLTPKLSAYLKWFNFKVYKTKVNTAMLEEMWFEASKVITEAIYAGFDEEFALFLEEELIQKLGRKDLGLGTLLNLTDGGEGHSGCIRSAATRAKIRKME